MRPSTPLVNGVSALRGLLAVLCVLSSVAAGTAVGQTLWEGNGPNRAKISVTPVDN